MAQVIGNMIVKHFKHIAFIFDFHFLLLFIIIYRGLLIIYLQKNIKTNLMFFFNNVKC